MIYGHSLGGFLTIRLSSHPSGWWEKSMQGIILESPATSFPLIIEKKTSGRAVMASPWVRHILRREYQRIHPDLNVGYANAQIPYWGSPKVPILVMQAEDDETLGVDQFMKEHFSENPDIHILSEMPHTSKVDVKERRNIRKMVRDNYIHTSFDAVKIPSIFPVFITPFGSIIIIFAHSPHMVSWIHFDNL